MSVADVANPSRREWYTPSFAEWHMPRSSQLTMSSFASDAYPNRSASVRSVVAGSAVEASDVITCRTLPLSSRAAGHASRRDRRITSDVRAIVAPQAFA